MKAMPLLTDKIQLVILIRERLKMSHTCKTIQNLQIIDIKLGAEIAQSVGWTTKGFEFESRYGQDISPPHFVETDPGAGPASYPMATGDYFPRCKSGPEREADHSPPASTEVNNTWIYTSTPPYVFTA
jgi:hypothetical protein